MEHPLDNPAFTALSTGNRDLALGTASAKYFPADVSPFAGVETMHDMEELYAAVPGKRMFALVCPEAVTIAAPWQEAGSLRVAQFIYQGPAVPVSPDAVLEPLGPGHVAAMVELTALTNPGPFFLRTILFGHYLGIFREGRLVAMAGYRMHAGDYIEVSAVCTHPSYTGMGYAQLLLAAQVNSILEQGKLPFLHVKTENTRAIGVYRHFGFTLRRELVIYSIVK